MHRTFSVNEFSTRYSDVPDVNDETPPDKWRLQSGSNRQGSSGDFVADFPDTFTNQDRADVANRLAKDDAEEALSHPGGYLSFRERELHQHQREVYQERLKFGVAKEQARKDLCLSTYTRAYWKSNLHNLLHFLGLRMDPHAQWEIRQFANRMGEVIEYLYPATWQAFLDYRLNAMTLTALDQVVVRNIVAADCAIPVGPDDFLVLQHPDWKELKRSRERDECLQKLRNLGLVQPA